MKNDQEGTVFPVAVFIDTNILDSLPEDLRAGDLSALVEACEQTGARVYVPDVVAREWLKHRLERFAKDYISYFESRDRLKKYVSTIPEFEANADDLVGSVYTSLVRRLKESGCRILPPPKVSIRELSKHAVWEVPPFRSGNKGFKDELVVAAMFKLVKQGWNYRTYVLVTKDADFKVESLRKRFRQRDLLFERVQSLHEAKDFLANKFHKEAVQIWLEERSKVEQEMKTFLSEQYWETIAKAVTRKFAEDGISMWTIYLGDRKDIPERAFIRRITGISPTMIATIDAGKEDEQTHGIPVTIGVQATLTLEVELSRLLTSVLCETIGLEGRKSREVSADAQLSEVDIVREIQCYGVVKRDSSGVLCELDLVDTRPDYYGMLSDISRDRQ